MQRSTDGMNFNEIAHKQGSGNSTKENYYSYLDDVSIFIGLYYRIIQIDYDGKFDFSELKYISQIKKNGNDCFSNHRHKPG